MAINLTLTATKVSNQNPLIGALVEYTDSNIANGDNRIGEKKAVRFSFTASKDISNFRLFVNPALFLNTANINTITGAGTRYYSFQFPAGIVGAGAGFATYTALGATFPNIDKLESVLISWTNNTTFSVIITYYQAYDFEGFLEPNIGDNHARLLKDRKSNPLELSAGLGSSVYSDTAVDLRAYFYMENAFVPSDNGYLDCNNAYGYKAGFYSEGTHGVAKYFTNPTFLLSRTSGTVTTLSSVENTVVSLRVTAPGALAVDYFVCTIIRTDKFDNTTDMVSNYDLQQALIDVVGTPTTKLVNFAGSTFLGSGVYACSLEVDKTTLNVGEKYRLIMHPYHNQWPTSYEVDAFISDEFEVNADVPYTGNGFDVTARLRDTLHGYPGNLLTCCIEERMRSQITLDYIDDYGIGMYARDIYNRLGLTIANDITRYLAKVEFSIYDTVSTPGYKHLVDNRVSYPVSPGNFLQVGMSLTFGTGTATFYADWRNRYESGVANIQTYNTTTGVSIGPTSNQYWGGRQFTVEWKLSFYYDDYITPFSDEVIIHQTIIVKDYVSCLQIHAQNAPDENKEFWCPEDTMCLRSEFLCLGGAPTLNYELITTIEPNPGSITTIQETEVFLPVLLPQQTSALILSQEDYYDNTLLNNAKFCVDVANLSFIDYKITALAKHT